MLEPDELQRDFSERRDILRGVKPDPVTDPPHQLAPKPETRFGARRDLDPELGHSPRYIDLPERRHAVHAGRRNLLLGSALLVAALFLVGLGVLVGGPRVAVWPLAAMITAAALWVLARLRVFRQRNGVFFGVAVVTLGGALLALAECGFHAFGTRPGAVAAQVSDTDAVLPQQSPAPEAVPLLTEALNLTPPDPAEGSRVKVLREAEVKIGGKSYRVREGETFPFEEAKGGEVTFSAGEFRAHLPMDDVQILGPQRVQPERAARTTASATPRESRPPATPLDPGDVEIERRSRAEAIRRFPALADKKSPENQEFVRTYNQLKEDRSRLLQDPEWPVRLAETLAKDLGWKQVDDMESDPPPDEGNRGVSPP